MPGNTLLPSVLGNVVATRQRLSQARQRLGLEPSSPNLRELAPSPPNGPSFKRTAAATDAAQREPDFDNFQLAPEKRTSMEARAQQWLDENNNGIPDELEADSTPAESTPQVVRDPALSQALTPLATFFKKNGRLPSVSELQQIRVDSDLEGQLGRTPTETERQLYLMKPPR